MSEQQSILVWTDLAPGSLAFLEAEGFAVLDGARWSDAEVATRLPHCEALIVGPGRRVGAALLDAAARLRVVAVAGAGVHGVDVAEATRCGVLVTHAPDSDLVSQAELALALLLACARALPRADAELRAGAWHERAWAETAVEVRGKTLGLVGVGAAGGLLAESAQALGMNVLICGPAGTAAAPAAAPEAQVFAEADLLVVDLPEGAPPVSAAELELLKPGARLVSMAGTRAVDEAALAAALRDGRVAAAALAVSADEAAAAARLQAAGGVLLAPRQAGATADARLRAARSAAEQIVAALRGELPAHAVNVPAADGGDAAGLMPYVGFCGQLGRLLVQLADAPVTAVDIAYDGSFAYFDTRLLTLGVLGGVLSDAAGGPVNFVNAQTIAAGRGVTARETRDARALDFPRMITVSAGGVSVSGTSFGPEQKPRLVRLFGEDVDIEPAAHMAFLRYVDVPGVGGRVGTLLGEWRVNIGHMSVGRGRLGDEAVMALTLDEPLSAAQVAELVQRCGLSFARAAEL